MKKYLNVILIVLLLSVIILLVTFQKNNTSSNCTENIIKQKQIDVNHFQKLIISNLYKNEFKPVNDCLLFFDNDSVSLMEISAYHPILVFYATYYNCTLCIDHISQHLKKHFMDYTTNPHIAIIYYDTNKTISNSIFDKTPFVTLEKAPLSLPMENRNMPFLFVLDKDMMAKMVFIPDKGMPELTDEYLKIIKKRFFNY